VGTPSFGRTHLCRMIQAANRTTNSIQPATDVTTAAPRDAARRRGRKLRATGRESGLPFRRPCYRTLRRPGPQAEPLPLGELFSVNARTSRLQALTAAPQARSRTGA
jgi:hypothetical protein